MGYMPEDRPEDQRQAIDAAVTNIIRLARPFLSTGEQRPDPDVRLASDALLVAREVHPSLMAQEVHVRYAQGKDSISVVWLEVYLPVETDTGSQKVLIMKVDRANRNAPPTALPSYRITPNDIIAGIDSTEAVFRDRAPMLIHATEPQRATELLPDVFVRAPGDLNWTQPPNVT